VSFPIPSLVRPGHGDHPLLAHVRDALFESVGGSEPFARRVPILLRQALDEVIDTPRTARISLDELEKTEKTYIGTKVEILIRAGLGLRRGLRLDLSVGGVEVDIKNTVRSNWSIPQEAVDECCLLVRIDEPAAICWTGLVVARDSYLNPGRNRDGKRTFSSQSLGNVLWLLPGTELPGGFWRRRDPAQVASIMDATASGSERVRRLFRTFQREPIPRDIVKAVARQLDALKRVRKNGGARDELAAEGIAILSGKYDAALLSELGFHAVGPDDFLSIKPENDAERAALAATLAADGPA
jgi:hypothetical protein